MIRWDKGKALEFLLSALGFADADDDVFPIYVGDDRTDEDAFKVLRKRGQGVGILVSKHPKDTSASYSLQEPAEASAVSVSFSGPGVGVPGLSPPPSVRFNSADTCPPRR